MSVNSSSSSSLPSNSSSIDRYIYWWNCIVRAEAFSMTAFTVTSILLVLPLCIYVIYLGFQKWRQQRSSATMSHSDIFTYNMVIIELINIVGSIIRCYGAVTHLLEGRSNFNSEVSWYLLSISISGQLLFHSLTCVERYLAVVHPITYLGLKKAKAKGIRIRNISIGCVWLLCFAQTGVQFMSIEHANDIFFFCALTFIFIVMSFCCLSVLYVLIRPGAGGEGRQRVHQSKRRAFNTIMAILGVLLLRVVGSIVNEALSTSQHVWESDICGAFVSTIWLNLPSSLVLPLLFLHRAGKLLCCKNINTSGQGSD